MGLTWTKQGGWPSGHPPLFPWNESEGGVLCHQFNHISFRVKDAAAVIIHAVKPRLTYYFVAFQYQLAGEFVDTFPAANREGQTYRIGGAGLHGRGYGGWSGGYEC